MLNYNKILNDGFINSVDNLFGRWLDEWMYEDIRDYANVIVSLIKSHNGEPLDITDIEPCEKPFGVKFTTPCDNKRWQLARTMTTISIKPIK